jgi:acyl carrier protein
MEALRGEERFPDLRLIRLTSETVHKAEVDFYKKYFSANCISVNILSSTETGPLREYFIDHKTDIATNEVPLGYPVEDKEILLMDQTGKELGFNEVGEIAVRSRYLSPGYWRRPDLTKTKFMPDPRGGEETIYLTGDLGLMLPDGCLVYKGRKDFRVKIRGYGVELAEVEKSLLEHEAIKEALLVSRRTALGKASLVAYFTSVTQPGPTVSELQRFLKQKLPDYMIPSIFVQLAALPLTATGKIERRMLPRFGNARPNLDTRFVAPTSPSEGELARIWSEVLSIDSVGIHDNFFDLGGHSLAATRIVSRVIQQFHLEIPLQSLFQSPTVGEMAAVIAQHQGKRLSEAELNRMVGELESISDEEAERLLSNQGQTDQRRK